MQLLLVKIRDDLRWRAEDDVGLRAREGAVGLQRRCHAVCSRTSNITGQHSAHSDVLYAGWMGCGGACTVYATAYTLIHLLRWCAIVVSSWIVIGVRHGTGVCLVPGQRA